MSYGYYGNPHMMEQQYHYPGNFNLIYGINGMAYLLDLDNKIAYMQPDIMKKQYRYNGELVYGNDGFVYEFINGNFYPVEPQQQYVLQEYEEQYYPDEQYYHDEQYYPDEPEESPSSHPLPPYNLANQEILERISILVPSDIQNNNISLKSKSLEIAKKADVNAEGIIRPAFIGSPRIWEYIKTHHLDKSSEQFKKFWENPILHSNSSTKNDAFILDNEHAFVFDSNNDEILKIRNDTEYFNFKFYFGKEGSGDNPKKSIFKRDDSIKILRTAIRKNTYIHFKDYNQTIVIIDNNTDFEFPKLYEELRKPKRPNLQSFFELIKEPYDVVSDRNKMNLLIDGENIINFDYKWMIDKETSLNKLIPHSKVDKIISFVNIIDKGKNKYNKYICIISRFRLREYYKKFELKEHDAKTLMDKLNDNNNTDLLIIEKTIPELNITIFFISLPFQEAAIMESARMNDFNKSAKSALVAQKLGPAFQEPGSESDDLLLIYIFFRCGGNILSFDKFKWLKAGKIKTLTEEYDFINSGDYFTDFYTLQVDTQIIPGIKLITNFTSDITELKMNEEGKILEIVHEPLPLGPLTDPLIDPTLLHSIIKEELTAGQKKKDEKRKAVAAAVAVVASNNSPPQGGGSKKIKMTKKKNNKKKITQKKKNKLTRKVRK